MHISANHSIAKFVTVKIDGAENSDCLRACEDVGWAEIATGGIKHFDNCLEANGNQLCQCPIASEIVTGHVELSLSEDVPEPVQHIYSGLRQTMQDHTACVYNKLM